MRERIEDRIEAAVGTRPRRLAPLSGGCIAEIYRVDFAAGPPVVAKLAGKGGSLEPEAYMLRYLATNSRLPVPELIHADDGLLIMTYLEHGGALDGPAQAHAAELLADLHAVTRPRFGHERDTPIGPLPQPNPDSDCWLDFFRDHRLLAMARTALEAGRLPAAAMTRIEALAARLETWIDEPEAPALIHGDMWGGNVLAGRGRIVGFVDPAIYYADAEIELAFATLFSTFGEPFFARYHEIRPIRPGFFEARRDLYNLYPLLAHLRLFGGSYLRSVEATLKRRGC
ncbi:MAG: fructosamine kinase family protein [Alphaproteobacteria bacterium]